MMDVNGSTGTMRFNFGSNGLSFPVKLGKQKFDAAVDSEVVDRLEQWKGYSCTLDAIDDKGEMILQDVAECFNVVRERIRQIEVDAITHTTEAVIDSGMAADFGESTSQLESLTRRLARKKS